MEWGSSSVAPQRVRFLRRFSCQLIRSVVVHPFCHLPLPSIQKPDSKFSVRTTTEESPNGHRRAEQMFTIRKQRARARRENRWPSSSLLHGDVSDKRITQGRGEKSLPDLYCTILYRLKGTTKKHTQRQRAPRTRQLHPTGGGGERNVIGDGASAVLVGGRTFWSGRKTCSVFNFFLSSFRYPRRLVSNYRGARNRTVGERKEKNRNESLFELNGTLTTRQNIRSSGAFA